MASTREENVYMAKLAQQANRYEDMVEFMEKAAELAKAEVIELTIEERDLLVAAYRKLSDARRASWRTVSTIMHKEESKGNENRVAAIRDYRAKIESEISSICDGFLSLLDDCLVPDAFTYESRAFYLMLKGDYHRYLAEINMAADRDAAAQSALDAYTSAQAAARFGLEPMHPIRLELALNFSLFYYYILKSPDLARNLGKQAIDDASAAIDALGGGRGHMLKLDYDAMMLRLDQNLRLWSSDAQDDEKDEIGASSQGNRNQDDK